MNISGTDEAIDKRKTVLTTTIFSTFDGTNFVHLRKRPCNVEKSENPVL